MLTYLAIITFMLAACSSATNSIYETIDINEVTTKMGAGYTVLDVREEEEFVEGHIENAQNKPLSLLKKEDFSELNKEMKYVVICRSGNRSQEASAILFAAGYDVINVSEGMSIWPGEVVTGQ